MAQASESTVSAILKEVYPGAIEDQLNNEVSLWALVEKEKVQLQGQGQHIVRPFRVQRNQGVGARNDTDRLPLPQNQTLTKAQINMSSNYIVGQITGRVIRTSFGSDAAFMNALEEEIRFTLSDHANEIGRQLFTGSGQLAKVVGAVSSSTSITVNDITYLRQAVGRYVEFWSGSSNQTTNDSALPSGYTGTQITAVNVATNVITVATAQTSISNGATIATSQSNTSATATKEMVGLDVIIDDTTDYGNTYFGVNRANGAGNYPILQGNRLDASYSLTESLMMQAVDQARVVGGGKIDMIYTDYQTRRTYANILFAYRKYDIATTGTANPQFAGGLKVSEDLRTQMGEGISFEGAVVAPSRLSPAGKMLFLDTSRYRLFQQSDIEWVMNADSILHPLLSTGYDAYEYSLFYDAQFYCEAPNTQAKIVNTHS